MSPYTDHNYITLDKKLIEQCYLCGKALDTPSTADHIIPNSLFTKGSPNRPQLPVHGACNNTKSKNDEWFVRQIQLMCGMNPEAFDDLNKLLSKAIRQKPNAYFIGHSTKIRDYKLARSLVDKNVWGLQIKKGNQTYPTLHVGEANSQRTSAYVKTLCRGLFARNVPGSTPDIPEMTGIQYAKSTLDGTYDSFMSSVKTLMSASPNTTFYQQWGNRILYGGSRVEEDISKGFVFIEFYGEVGYLAYFK